MSSFPLSLLVFFGAVETLTSSVFSTADNTNLYRRILIVNKMSTPRRSKRQSKSDYAFADGRPRIELNDTLQDLKAIGPIRSLPNDSTSSKFLELCLFVFALASSS